MKTLVSNLLLVVVVALAIGVVALSRAEVPDRSKLSSDESAPVSVTKFWKAMPLGYLGVPLGTVVRVTGVAINGNTIGSKADAGKTLLRIEGVNGKKLESPVNFEFLRASHDVQKPAFGDRFDYYVHEYGEFDGVVTPPKELGINTEIVANDGFYYRRYVTVHASSPIKK